MHYFWSQHGPIDVVDGLEPNTQSLAFSIELANDPLEVNVCRHEFALKEEVSPILLKAATKWDAYLANAHDGAEKLYGLIEKVLQAVLDDRELRSADRRSNLDALAALLSVVNGLEERLESALKRLDGISAATMSQSIGSLIAVDTLTSSCACIVPTAVKKQLERTVGGLTDCVLHADTAVLKAFDVLCAALETLLQKGVWAVISLYISFSICMYICD